MKLLKRKTKLAWMFVVLSLLIMAAPLYGANTKPNILVIMGDDNWGETSWLWAGLLARQYYLTIAFAEFCKGSKPRRGFS